MDHAIATCAIGHPFDNRLDAPDNLIFALALVEPPLLDRLAAVCLRTAHRAGDFSRREGRPRDEACAGNVVIPKHLAFLCGVASDLLRARVAMAGAHLFPVQEYSPCMLTNLAQPFYSATWLIQLPCAYRAGADVPHPSRLKLCSAFVVSLIGVLASKRWIWRRDGRNVGGGAPG